VFCFDSWIREFRKERNQLTGQFHDEVVLEVKKGHREDAIKLLRDAIDRVNDKLQLNVKLDIDIKFGDCYADVH
jgi:DNA polymerase I-like protein with 3'-5' exonuclease and polymerase domains